MSRDQAALTTEMEWGAALLRLVLAVAVSRAQGWRGPSIVRETDGWRVSVHRIDGRRFVTRIEELDMDPARAMHRVATRLVDA